MKLIFSSQKKTKSAPFTSYNRMILLFKEKKITFSLTVLKVYLKFFNEFNINIGNIKSNEKYKL